MTRILVHIGAPKTATTTLQYLFKSVSKNLSSLDIQYFPTAALRKTSLMEDLEAGRPEAVTAQNFPRPQASRFFISNEGFTNYLMPKSENFSWSKGASRTAHLLSHLPYSVERIVLTIRRQDQFLLSSYYHWVLHGRVSDTFEGYCNGLDFRKMSWLRYIERLESLIGSERLAVVPFSIIREGAENYAAAVVDALGIKGIARDSWPRNVVRNETHSLAAMEACRRSNAHHAAQGYPWQSARSLNAQLVSALPVGIYQKAHDSYIASVTRKMSELFEEENKDLADKYFGGNLFDMSFGLEKEVA